MEVKEKPIQMSPDPPFLRLPNRNCSEYRGSSDQGQGVRRSKWLPAPGKMLQTPSLEGSHPKREDQGRTGEPGSQRHRLRF